MARLPTIGSDTGSWGSVLNTFLGVSLTSDGKIKLETWANAAARPGTPTTGQIGVNLQTGIMEQYDGASWGEVGAKLASPTFTGTPLAPTASASTNTTQIATTAFVQTGIAAGVGSRMTIGFGADGAGSVIATGARFARVMPFACTITGWGLVADQSGSITVDLRKGTPSGGSVSTSTITASATPALSSARVTTSTTLTGWTTSIAAGDVLEMVVTGTPATLTRFALNVNVTLV